MVLWCWHLNAHMLSWVIINGFKEIILIKQFNEIEKRKKQ